MNDYLSVIARLIRQSSESEEAREQAVFAAWLGAVGSQVRRVTVPVRLERRILIVAVTGPAWKSQLKSISRQVLQKLNSLLGARLVEDLEFVENEELVSRYRTDRLEVTFKAPEKQAEPLRSKARDIQNQAVREAFLRAAGKCLDRRSQV